MVIVSPLHSIYSVSLIVTGGRADFGNETKSFLTYTNHGICCYPKKSGLLIHNLKPWEQCRVVFHFLELNNGALQGGAMFPYKIIASLQVIKLGVQWLDVLSLLTVGIFFFIWNQNTNHKFAPNLSAGWNIQQDVWSNVFEQTRWQRTRETGGKCSLWKDLRK